MLCAVPLAQQGEPNPRPARFPSRSGGNLKEGGIRGKTNPPLLTIPPLRGFKGLDGENAVP